MSYCVNPDCPNPNNSDRATRCQGCGSKLLLRDRYRIVEALGQGGFGATFIAMDQALPGKPICVIKQLRPASTSPNVLDMARKLFKREAETLGRIGDHPQVPRLLDYFESDNQFYLVQEYVSGKTLKQEVKKQGTFSEQQVREFLEQILPLVKYLHDNEVIHRDIKPANIIRRDIDRKLVLIDFGAVKDKVSQTAMLNANSTGDTIFTSFAIGTPGFAPQEQMAQRPVYASDIYAVGATCLYLLTGKSPKHFGYDPMSGELIWRPHVYVSDRLAALLDRMLAASVRDRFGNAEQALRELHRQQSDDDLSGSLSSQGRGRSSPTDEDTELDQGGSSAWVSPVVSQVQLLRARKGKKPRPGQRDPRTELNRGHTIANSDPTGMRTQTLFRQGSSNPEKLDASGVRLAYTKGRRDFADSDLVGLNLAKANLSGSNFYDAKMNRINLQEANLFNANFGRASLLQANLRDANLSKAYLVNANLAGADLRGADLSNASLMNANLHKTNLCGANLTGARIADSQLAMARTNWRTIKPNGKGGLFG
ncbi:serine/threonine-protein kinase [Oxynema aestuarii]|uniref:Serine/threonine-protein kinase B n=1 Tax=Oxynema aestuarii AP17 TaxID=2064643 RepID=A0A6H1TWC0_9CYAN|nr:serine/threonine-protein kinase [Oxynema aestuarii]QIZ69619.1 protein kinase [Oxynema aestuarii AP17]RMH77266.1 MAG: serine/threonine protein kinase [Cyanobacteria bacterium J007]